jgi:hypothetical protein
MSQNLGLSAAERNTFEDALRTHRQIRTSIDILDLDGKHRTSLDNRIVSGDVTVDVSAEITRSMSLTLWDPTHRLRMDSDSPGDGALYADKMIRAKYGVLVGGVGWVDVPVFTGPIVSLSRDDATMTVEAQGKEAMGMTAAWQPLTIGKGVEKVDAIRRIMRERAGESKFDFPAGKAKMPKAFSLSREDMPWTAAQKIARGMDMQLFYDGSGRLRLRRPPERPAFSFNSQVITTVPQVSFSTAEMKNAVRVTGRSMGVGKEDGGEDKQVPTETMGGVAIAPRAHPLSPWRLGRNGDPWFIPEFISDDTIKTNKEARALARRTLRDRLEQAVEISFDSLPIPHLDEGDLVRVRIEDEVMTTRLRSFGIPLTHDGTMPIGYVRRVSRPRRRRVNRS